MIDIVEILKTIASEYQLEQSEWIIPKNCPIGLPSSASTGYEKNVYLKEHFHSVIANDHTLNSHYWVIQNWGGIRSFKKNDRNNERINKFIKELSEGELSKHSFDAISSLSKVASFLEPNEYVIYDSKVIYALNWLLFNYSKEQKLFPQPVGRSAILAKYHLQTIFSLTKKTFEYRSHKKAYHQYCSMMKQLSEEVFGRNCKPYRLEMLLFITVPIWTVPDIEAKVSLDIKSAT